MKTTAFSVVAVATSFALLSGCASTPNESASVDNDSMAQQYEASGPQGQAQADNTLPDPRALSSEQQALLDQTRLLFDFDRAGLRPEHQAIIEAHARHLLANPDVQITLEGHADERGTREYNLALGERRAVTVEDALLMQGVPRKQLRTTSLGEEDPVVNGQSERSYQENRRVELKYQNGMHASAY